MDEPVVKLLSCAQLAKHYGVATTTISNNVSRCDLPVAKRKGRKMFFDPAAVEQWHKTHQDRLKPRPGGRHPKRMATRPGRVTPPAKGRAVQVRLTMGAEVLNRAERLVKRLQETPFRTTLSDLVEHGLTLVLRDAERTFSK